MRLSILDDPMKSAANKFHDRPAIVDGDRQWSFREFDRSVSCAAKMLAAMFPRGSRIVFFMKNCAEFLIFQYAAERSGIIHVPVNYRYTEHQLAQVIEDCKPVAVLCDTGTRSQGNAVLNRQFPQVACESVETLMTRCRSQQFNDDGEDPVMPTLDDVCSINYTSGTSGQPKGVVLTHRNWHAVSRNMLIDRDIRQDDVVAHIGPLTHASGTYFRPYFLCGALNVILNPPTVDELLRLIDNGVVTAFTCVPTVLSRIVSHPDVGRIDFSRLRAVGFGGEPMPESTLGRAQALMGDTLTLNYGLTEAMMTCTTYKPPMESVDAVSSQRRKNCIGRPYSFVQIAIRDGSGAPVPIGENGELTIRSDHMMQGYWNKPDETAATIRDGWLWSGDTGWMDDEGYIYLNGRRSEMLISGGFNIYPAEVEAVINSHPAVKESVVVGIPDISFGEIAVALVGLHPGIALERDELRDYCRPVLGIKTPKKWTFMESLPRTPNGKIDKKALRSSLLGEGQ